MNEQVPALERISYIECDLPDGVHLDEWRTRPKERPASLIERLQSRISLMTSAHSEEPAA
jgi:hypothetical protein